jgi:transcription elongation GreA/GreB family factor
LKVEDETVFAVSPDAPLGKLLLMKKAGDVFQFNTTAYEIISVE